MTAQAGGASPPSAERVSPRQARKRLRTLRSSIAPSERAAAHLAIHRTLRHLQVWRPGHRVAVFLGMPDEVDLRPAFTRAWRRGVRLYVPLILNLRAGAMAFVPYERDARLRRNWFGIDEPVDALSRRVQALELDTVLVPLLGFDAAGHRLGMGAGFYDRALRRRRDRALPFRRPRLIGVAYEVQRVAAIEPAPWDIALDLVVTERGIHRGGVLTTAEGNTP